MKIIAVAEGLLRCGVVDHDEVLVLAERVHNTLYRVGTRAKAWVEVVLGGEAVALRELREVVESRK